MRGIYQRPLAFLCVMAMLLSLPGLVPPAAAAGAGDTVTEDGFTGKINADGASVTLTLVDSALKPQLVLPGELGGLPVTALKAGLFSGPNKYRMTSLVIPASVTEIDQSLMSSDKLRNITRYEVAPGSPAYKTDSEGVLFTADGHTLIAYPRARAAGDYAVPQDVTRIADRAFYYAVGLSSVRLPEGLASIGDSAFAYSGLTSASLPDSVTELGKELFTHCISMTQASLGMADIPSGMFAYCQDLARLELKEGVEAIGYEAFRSCGRLKEVALPDTLTSIGENAFQGSGLTSLVLPGDVKTIGRSAFYYCNGLTSVTLNEGLTEIGQSAFQGVPIVSIDFPSTLTTISERAFSNSGLTSLDIPANVTSIGTQAFADTSLTTVTLPATVTSLGRGLFSSCALLTSATVEPGIAALPSDTFDRCGALTSVSLPLGMTGIGSSAFAECSLLEAIDLPGTVTELGGKAFYSSGLKEIDLPDGIAKVPDSAFERCTSLSRIGLPDRLTSIGADAFLGCESLQSITLPAGVTDISSSAFGWCTALVEVVFLGEAPKNVKTDPFPDHAGMQFYRPAGSTGFGEGSPWAGRVFHEGLPDKLEKKPIAIGLTASLSHSRQDKLILWLTMDVTPRVYSDEVPIAPSGAVTTYIRVQGEEGGKQPDARYFLGGNTTTFRTFGYDMEDYVGKDVEVFVTMDEGIGFQAGESNHITGGVGQLTDLSWDHYEPFGDSDGDAQGFQQPAYSYESDGGGGARITGIGSRDATSATVNIPDTVDGLPVTALKAGLFKNCVALETLTLPATLVDIGADCFAGCLRLKTISVRPVAAVALAAAEEEGVDLPDGLTGLGERAFQGCASVTSVRLPAGLTVLGAGAFQGCAALTELTFPAGLDELDASVLEGVTLQRAFFPGSVPEMPVGNPFTDMEGLTVYVPEDADTSALGDVAIKPWDGSSVPVDPEEPEPTPTVQPTPSEEPTPTVKPTPSDEPTPTVKPTPSEEPTPTVKPTPSDEPTPTVKPTPSDEPTPTVKPTPSDEPTPTVKPTPSDEPTPTVKPTPSDEPTPTVKPTPSDEPTPTVKPTPSDEPTPTVKPTPSDEPTPSTDPSPSTEPSPEPSTDPSPEPSVVPSPEPTERPSGGGSSGGGSSSGGSSSSSSSSTKTTTVKESTKVVLGARDVNAAVKAAKDGGPVVLNADAPKGTKTVAVTLPAKLMKTVADSEAQGVSLKTPVADITLDAKALEALPDAGKKDVVVSAGAADTSALPKAAWERLEGRLVYDISITSGGKAVSKFGGGTLMVALPYTPARDEDEAGLVAAYVDEEGRTEILQNSMWQDGRLIFTTPHLSAYAILNVPDGFTDSAGHWAVDDIRFIAARGIVNGMSADAFEPQRTVTGSMAVTVLGRMAGVAGPKDGENWDAPYLAWARREGLLPTGFEPAAPLPREQLAALLDGYLDQKAPDTENPKSYTDEYRISAECLPSVRLVQSLELMQGRTDGSFDPKGFLTRAELAATVRRLLAYQIQ